MNEPPSPAARQDLVERAKRAARIGRQPLLSLWNWLRSIGRPRSGVLVYVGMHRGRSFDSIFRRYERCLGFEANPEMFAYLQKRYARHSSVELFNLAVATENGELEFNVSSNDGMSSSIGNFDEDWEVFSSGQVRMEKTIRVPCVNLMDFLQEQGVERIEDYISDIQGMDLTVLRTLKPMIDAKRIGSIQCEVARDEKVNVFSDLAPNNEQGFRELLDENYELAGKGWGVVREGEFREVPPDWWEMDCKWVARP